ncbi:MAG: hypothetical protein WDA18_02995 [Candidatus Ratteibacteria bacterium]|jgi:FtsH-binding integral membrane protein
MDTEKEKNKAGRTHTDILLEAAATGAIMFFAVAAFVLLYLFPSQKVYATILISSFFGIVGAAIALFFVNSRLGNKNDTKDST